MSDKQMAWAIVKPNGDFVLQTIEVGEDESWDAFIDNCGGFVTGWKQDGYSCQRVTISLAEQRDVSERVAQITAHRAVGNQEQDLGNGKIAGYCAVCQTVWPCAYAGTPPAPPSSCGLRQDAKTEKGEF